ncbi:MAG: hypothetical protein CVU34_19695 [Betaproteobacteria bacterium HGW-Betaproteobacteria-7]|jgi:uncharacterized membrane protein|nr:MAG: hypothetical protein CVU34_19695 [Betaproteobacteria bacterium HGW-Betaproteobacteria-7]
MNAILHFLHLTAVILWIGGMFFAHFCLRPVVVTQLPPPQRLPLMSAVLGRFFAAVALAVIVILLSGLAMLLPVGMAQAPMSWHLMLASGLLMTFIFAVIYLRHYPRLRAAVATGDWPLAAAALNSIRLLVATNLALGTATVAIAIIGKYL